MKELESVIARMDPISLGEMDQVRLLDRSDTKFAFASEQLCPFLEVISGHYRILEIAGNRVSNYRSFYFDTPELKFYHDHHRGKVFRSKVRFREYSDSGLCFLEVKMKDGRGRTMKSRCSKAEMEEILSPESHAYLREITGEDLDLQLTLENFFQRITLVHKNRPERFTIDLNLGFKSPSGSVVLSNLVIAEIKQSRQSRQSPAFAGLRAAGIRPSGLSKYCLGIMLSRPETKFNNFKRKRLLVDKIQPAITWNPHQF